MYRDSVHYLIIHIVIRNQYSIFNYKHSFFLNLILSSLTLVGDREIWLSHSD